MVRRGAGRTYLSAGRTRTHSLQREQGPASTVIMGEPRGGEGRLYSVPLVEGMPVLRGSRAVAWSSARAKALKAASMM